MKKYSRAVVIGGGVAGCSTIYHLAKRGIETVLCERNTLTSGSTWHAAGLLPLFNMSYAVAQLHKYSIDLYKTLEEETGQDVGFHVCGNIRLAHTQARMDEYKNYAGVARSIGVDYQIITPEKVKELWPLSKTDDLVGALWHNTDGHIAPADLCMAFVKGARNNGGEIYEKTCVTDIEKAPSGEWIVKTDKGDIQCEYVVTASGSYTNQLLSAVGVKLPMIPVEHQYIVTDIVPELQERLDAGLPEMAILRESDASYYLREEQRNRYLLGPYEKGAKPCYVDGVSHNAERELFQGDLDRLLPHVEACMVRVPSFENAGIKEIINGAIAYTPDGNPMIGPIGHGLENFFIAEGFSFGITAGGGAGKVIADQIVEGETDLDTFSIDARRFSKYANKQYTLAKNVETYEHLFTVHYPMEERPGARPARTSPCYDRLAARGAVFGQRVGWERANWFADAPNTKDDWTFRQAQANWFPALKRESEAMRDACGLIDMTNFVKYEAYGAGTEAFLERIFANKMPKKIGGVKLVHGLYESGGTHSEFTVTKMGDNCYYLVSSSAGEGFDYDLLRRNLPKDGSVHIHNVTNQYGVFVLAGPNARKLLRKITDANVENDGFKWLTGQAISVGYAPDVMAMRVNYVGELGWELHHPIEYQNHIFDLIEDAGKDLGLRHVGMRAMDSMRVEKSYRAWGPDLNRDYSPIEAGLDRMIDMNKEFIGKAGLIAREKTGLKWKFAMTEIDGTEDAHCFGNEAIYKDGKKIGRVSSGGFGHRLQRSFAMSFVDPEYAQIGTEFEVMILEKPYKAKVIADSPYDPNNEKLKSAD
ncbi:MAG: FAD-dependent oxidoreductase [Alphaproteobacteria bacterium]|nr:FAD-dependent oxidoreductase [Alphaproteobacteria bacterium]